MCRLIITMYKSIALPYIAVYIVVNLKGKWMMKMFISKENNLHNKICLFSKVTI